ncbi:MAG: hypothetical protein LBE13_06305 [Bacteroidales bacterium]|jgi:hypothetical protein|nr:hypothetical protein [Bacteroidales bacterium]
MKKYLLVITVTVLGMNTLKAQEPVDVRFKAEIGFGFVTSQGTLQFRADVYDPHIYCTRHRSLYSFSTDKDAFSFDKPVYTPQIGSLAIVSPFAIKDTNVDTNINHYTSEIYFYIL